MVYVGIYKLGNQFIIVIYNYKIKGVYSIEDGKFGLKIDVIGVKVFNIGVIVCYDGEVWRDYYGIDWNFYVLFNLFDYDVFEIDVMVNRFVVSKIYVYVGNVLFNLVVNFSIGVFYVSNLEVCNELCFEGYGECSDEQILCGCFIENWIIVIKEDVVMLCNLNLYLSDSNFDGSFLENV